MRKLTMALVLLVVFCLTACHKEQRSSGKLQVVATLFPLYDFARQVGGDKAEVTLLLPPGVEPHSFEPKPDDIIRVSRADLFIFTNRYMEPWAAKITGAVSDGRQLVVDASRGVQLFKAEQGHEAGETHEGGAAVDPHIWLDFANDQIIVDTIMNAFATKDPANRDYYAANAAALKKQLAALDERFKKGLASCAKRTIFHGGHFAFGYLARRYNLGYESAYALNADAEPTASKLAQLIREMRQNGVTSIYTEELLNPRVAETIAKEAGAGILKLNGAHNISRQDFERKVTFISLMDENLKNLRTGLQCR